MNYSPDFEKWWGVNKPQTISAGAMWTALMEAFKEVAWKAYQEGTKHDYLVQDEDGNWMTEDEHHSLYA
jgi:hypothetical protein